MGRARTAAVSRAVALCCLALGVAACSSHREGESGSAVGSGAGTSGAGGGSAGSGPLLQVGNSPDCPELEPVEADSCEPAGLCEYPACGAGNLHSLWECRAGAWQALRRCDAECPASRPAPFSDCTSYWGLSCPYTEDACGTEQRVVADCSQGTWKLWGPSRGDEDVSPACQLSYPDGAECVLPDGCSALTCYGLSCYGQPIVSECLDGKWRVQTSCSK